MRSGRAAGLTLGDVSGQFARLPVPDATTTTSTSGYRVTREPPGALAERSESERWLEQAAARPGRVGPA